MYSIAGYQVKAEQLCGACAEKEIRTELDIETEQEIAYLLYPSRKNDRQEMWPMRFREYGYEEPYIYDAMGNVIMASSWYVGKDDPIHAHYKEVSPIYDDGTHEDEVNCGSCGETLIEPYVVPCALCDRKFMTGSLASRVENLYQDHEYLICAECFEQEQEQVRLLIAQRIEAIMLDTTTGDKEYWQYAKKLGLFIAEKPHKNLFQHVLSWFQHDVTEDVSCLSSLFDVMALLEGNVSVADTIEPTVDATIVQIMRETCKDTALLMTPAYTVYDRLERGEKVEEADIIAY